MATIKPVKVEGLRDLQKALKELDGEAQKELRLVLNNIAETVVGGASRRVPTKSGKARRSLKATSSQREAKVRGGGNSAPYYGWLDFGGKTGRNRSVNRTFLPSGRYIYPAYEANQNSITKAMSTQLSQLIERHGLEVD